MNALAGRARRPPASLPARRVRLLSYNIQAGLHTRRFHHYLTGAWRHALPARERLSNLMHIADMLGDYDVVAVQEADAGSIRTLQRGQIDYLAERAGFPYSGQTVTRNLAPLARICLGYLSHVQPLRVTTHTLPSRIPGRGALELEFGADGGALTVVVTHLSLDPRSRRRQLDYLGMHLVHRKRTVLIGDFNCDPEFLLQQPALAAAGIEPVRHPPATYPSWAPRRALDQVLVTPDIEVHSLEALRVSYSDHLPLAVDLGLPE